MNKTISLLRAFILVALCAVSLLLIMNIENDESALAFALHAVFDKGLGILGFYIFHLLYTHWSKIDPWISAYDKYCKKGMDAPNPFRAKDDNDYWQ